MTRMDPTKPIRSGCLTSEEPPPSCIRSLGGSWEGVSSPGLPRVLTLSGPSDPPVGTERKEIMGIVVRALRAGQASCPRDFAGRKLGPEERFLVS